MGSAIFSYLRSYSFQMSHVYRSQLFTCNSKLSVQIFLRVSHLLRSQLMYRFRGEQSCIEGEVGVEELHESLGLLFWAGNIDHGKKLDERFLKPIGQYLGNFQVLLCE
ncbi:hypothetical protein FGO68_gene14764 [Halteria grandinella]|uniref:Uncharacterized protein n=1 Tax=Halteria grandinella TaxID=5974 RepID=A0A8J8P0D9_HALGN|nr:hypothetical protein FGO68_gene14764 [Halteria grandinella]